jgi:nucleoside 2-deoxyribosyltransferase
MSRRKLVYVAGPYTTGDKAANVAEAVRVGHALIEAGYAPIVPHLSHYMPDQPYETWMEIDFSLLEHCDFVVRRPGDSPGADRECELAMQLGIPVYDLERIDPVKPS